MPLDGEGDQTILFEICPEINKTVSKKKKKKYRRVSSVVEHSSANPKVPGSIPGPVSYRGHGL